MSAVQPAGVRQRGAAPSKGKGKGGKGGTGLSKEEAQWLGQMQKKGKGKQAVAQLKGKGKGGKGGAAAGARLSQGSAMSGQQLSKKGSVDLERGKDSIDDDTLDEDAFCGVVTTSEVYMMIALGVMLIFPLFIFFSPYYVPDEVAVNANIRGKPEKQ